MGSEIQTAPPNSPIARFYTQATPKERKEVKCLKGPKPSLKKLRSDQEAKSDNP